MQDSISDNKIRGLFWIGDVRNYYLGHQWAEIFKDKVYAPYLEQKKDAIVIDIGANVGVFTLYASLYAKHVYSFEPANEHFKVLEAMIKYNNIKNVTTYKKAINNVAGNFQFFHNANKTMYSLNPAVRDQSPPEEVEGITLDTALKDIPHVHLLKLDIEGSEAHLLGSEGFRLAAPKIDVIVLETHTWMGRHENQIKESLKNAGFKGIKKIPNEASLFVAQKEPFPFI